MMANRLCFALCAPEMFGVALSEVHATPRAAGHTVVSPQEVCPVAHGLCFAVRVQ
jgi:hypothetical protein